MVPPGATMFAGTPTASIAVSTPRPPVIVIVASAGLPDRRRRTETFRYVQTVIVEIHHDDLRPGVELRGQKRAASPIGPAPTMATMLPSSTFALSTPHSKPVGTISLNMTSDSSSAGIG
jgi:hypothetical protein